MGATIGVILGDMLGLYWDNGKENGNYCHGLLRGYRSYIGVIVHLLLSCSALPTSSCLSTQFLQKV